MTWTDERIAQLRDLWAEGLTAAECAVEIGGITRNAVVGKVFRLKLEPRQERVNPKKRHAKRKARKPAVKIEPPPPPDPTPPTSATRVSLMELRPNTCRWPTGDVGSEDFFFCGAPTHADKPYCGYHCRLAYQPKTKETHLERRLRKLAYLRECAA